jgi:hypothetical protein
VTLSVQVRQSTVIPVGKVFIKQRLDLLTARAWMEENKEQEKEVVELSCDESVPSAYTTLVNAPCRDPESNNAFLGFLRDRKGRKGRRG